MKRDSFIFYRSFAEAINVLEGDEKIALVNAIIKYALDGEIVELTSVASAMFSLIKPQIEANNRRYENGKKGGRPKTETKPNENQNVTEIKPKQNQNISKAKPNVNVNVNDNVNVNANDNNKGATKVADVISDCPIELQDTMKAFVEHRKTIKKPLSPKATELIIGKALKLANNDLQQANRIIEQSIERGWQGVFPLDEKVLIAKTSKLDELKQAWNELEQQKGVLLNE